VALISISPPPIYDTDFNSEFENWLTLLVDELNGNFESMVAQSANIAGGSVGPYTITVEGMDADSIVVPSIKSVTNPATIQAVTPTTDAFDITFDVDPGVSEIYFMARLY